MMNIKSIISVAAVALCAFSAPAMIYHCDSFNSSKKTCRLIGWSGQQPSSGKLKLPSTFTHTDGVEYTITRVANHALDNLTEVTQLTIPAAYTVIGNADGPSLVSVELKNFENCPNLTTFKAESASTLVEAIDGILYLKGGRTIIKVPAKCATGSTYTLPSNVKYISADAFIDNSIITTLKMPKNLGIHLNGGINRMTKLKTIELTSASGGTLKLKDAVLYDTDRVVACPPKATISSFSVPSSVETIEEYAFHNVSSLTSVTIPSSITKIGRDAFSGSGITSVKIPATVTKVGEGLLANCTALSSIKLQMDAPELPDHFATGCSALTKLTTEDFIRYVGDAAFKNCPALDTYPFDSRTKLHGDSAFYNTGFTRIEFNEYTCADYLSGEALFSNCRKLTELDFSKMDTSDQSLSLSPYFGANCMQLTSLILPDFVSFWQHVGTPTPPSFGYYCMLEKIVLHTLWGLEGHQFCYSTSSNKQHYYPRVYAAVSKNDAVSPEYNKCYLGQLFGAGNGATVSPIFFVDVYDMDNSVSGENYVDANATYFVPGGASSHYAGASEAGCRLEEMFNLNFEVTPAGYLKVKATPRTGVTDLNPVTDFAVQFGDGSKVALNYSGEATSTEKSDYLTSATLHYKVDGVDMMTKYPKKHWLETGVDTLTEADAFSWHMDGDKIILAEEAEYEIYSASGLLFSIGHGSVIDRSAFASSPLIIRLTTPTYHQILKIK